MKVSEFDKIIPAEGRYDGLDEDTYHRRWEAWNVSRLKMLDRSPAHCYYAMTHPGAKKETDALKLGSAMHCALLEPDRFEIEYQLEPQQPADNAAKSWRATKLYKDQVMELAGYHVSVLKRQEWDGCRQLQERLLSEPSAARDLLMETYATEVSFAVTDPETGLLCKIRADALTPDTCWDLKKCESLGRFRKQVYDFGYYMSVPFYIDLLNVHEPGMSKDYQFLVVEDSPPYEFQVFELNEESEMLGRRKVDELLRVAADCVKNDYWPGLPRDLQTLSLPAWAFTQ